MKIIKYYISILFGGNWVKGKIAYDSYEEAVKRAECMLLLSPDEYKITEEEKDVEERSEIF